MINGHKDRFDVLSLRLNSCEYLSHQADLTHYQELCSHTLSLAEMLNVELDPLPDVRAPHAFRAVHEIYGKLQRRFNAPPSPAAQQQAQETRRIGVIEEIWSRYVVDYQTLIDLKARHVINDDMAFFLELKPGDFEEPFDPQSRYAGRRPDWQATASRISNALGHLQVMSPAARAIVPFQVALEKSEQRAEKLEQRVSELERIVRQ